MKPSERPELQAMMKGIGRFSDAKLIELLKTAEKMTDLLHTIFESRNLPAEPMLMALAMVLIEGSQDMEKFTRETFLEWMGEQWDAMARDGLN